MVHAGAPPEPAADLRDQRELARDRPERHRGEAPCEPDGTQLSYIADTTGAEFGQVGEKYGWLVEIDPRHPGSRVKKHTSLGRFRHENIAIRAEEGNHLVCYTGDYRRGGHWWKFVSKGTIKHRKDKSNSQLFEEGTLHVARFNADGTGQWIPLLLSTPTHPNRPADLVSRQIALQPPPYVSGITGDRNGLNRLPRRSGVAGQAIDGGFFGCTTVNEAAAFTAYPAGYLGTTLASFYPSQGAILCHSEMGRRIDVQDPAGGMFHHDQHIQEAKRGRDHHTKVTRHEPPPMILHKGLPALRRDTLMSPMTETLGYVLPHGARRDLNTQLEHQFVHDALFTP